MEIDGFVKGVVAALLTDQVDGKAGLAAKVGWIGAALAALGVVFGDGWLRGLAVLVLLVCLAFLVFVYVSRRFAKAIINRFAPPVEMSQVRANFDAAVAEADLPTGPVSLLRLVWRLRKGVGPEVDRLLGVVSRLRDDLDRPG